jgi:hypothetical protein
MPLPQPLPLILLVVNFLKLSENDGSRDNAFTILVIFKVVKLAHSRYASQSVLHWCILIELWEELTVVLNPAPCLEARHAAEMPRGDSKYGIKKMGVSPCEYWDGQLEVPALIA